MGPGLLFGASQLHNVDFDMDFDVKNRYFAFHVSFVDDSCGTV